ncbi:glycosyltransferase [Aeromicrobium sp. S22]|uniref:glycosyltransferase family 2 protein n=1 Tax=Aeromicrobium sp. S22 TaxID=2662029 RepID=UPI00129E8BB9|nr:glycosyltransferase family A protein [Aeromicrobium sp. S22]MRK02702.1 glycosyltransferase [Aeromicrobium sp. S22]
MSDHLDVLREQMRYIDVDPYSVASTAIRFGFPGALDLLSLMATDGREDYASLTATAERFAASGALRAPDELRERYAARPVGALAQALVGRAYRDPDYASSARMHRLAHALGPVDDQPTGFPRLLLQTQLAAGQHAYLDALLADDPTLADDHLAWVIRTDRLGPAVTGSAFDARRWSESFTEIFAPHGVTPVRLGDSDRPVFDRLETAAVPPSVDPGDGPLVTVVMSVYAPDESLETAVRSILAQTWTAFELLVVDDCSPAEFTARIDAVADWDPRVRVLRMAENGGTYPIRNRALAEARGELMTFQDSDDWSHPERLARQVAVLVDRPEVVATLSSWVRLTPDLVLNRVGYDATRVNASSMMFRIAPVRERLGGFDPVRKDADSEFRNRLETVFGEEAVVPLPDMCAVAQLTADSLSRDDFSFGWRAATRDAYGVDAGHWHHRIAAGRVSPFLDPQGPRRFPAPASFLTRTPAPVTCDVAYVSDWRTRIHRYDAAPRRVRALTEAGLDVHLGQAMSLRHAFRIRRNTLPDVLDMRASGEVGWLVWTEPVHAAVTFVDSPELLMFPRSTEGVRLTTGRLVVAAGTPTRVPQRDWTLYDPATVERAGRELFGVDVEWLPAHDGVAADLRSHGATATILPPRSIGVVDPGARRGSGARPRPVVATAQLERMSKNRLKGTQIVQCLPPDAGYDVRILDDDDVVPGLFRKNPVPETWTLVHGVPLADFLSEVDFYVGYAPDAWGTAPTWPMLQALAAGAVLVVDPRHRPALGDAAVYADPAGVRGVVDALAADATAYAAQRARGDAFVRSELDPARFAAFVAGLRG